MAETQDKLLLNRLIVYYNDPVKLNKMLSIINGESCISLRIVDWFATNYAKAHYTVIHLEDERRVKVYVDYKLNLKAYSKKRFDPFCRWERITIPKDATCDIQTTIGQLNFFRWAMDNKIIDYIERYYKHIEADMNTRNSTSKNKSSVSTNKTRKKREELSKSISRSIHKEDVEITLKFD